MQVLATNENVWFDNGKRKDSNMILRFLKLENGHTIPRNNKRSHEGGKKEEQNWLEVDFGFCMWLNLMFVR